MKQNGTSDAILDQRLLDALAANARQADEQAVWPEASYTLLKQLGGLRWNIPKSYGGDEYSGADALPRYESLAGACLTTCFLLSQRDAACRRLRGSGKQELCQELFPAVLSGER